MTISIARKFPKLESGNDCAGRLITGPNGERLGAIVREIQWIDVGILSVVYRAKVTGYKIESYSIDAEDAVYPTLSEATAAARKLFQ